MGAMVTRLKFGSLLSVEYSLQSLKFDALLSLTLSYSGV